MKTLTTDVAVIGAGTAGLSAWRAARKHTERVLLIEGGPYGTTCARVGCMPSKLLIAAAEAAHHVREAHRFGVHAEPPRIDGEAVMARVRAERDRFVGFVVDDVEKLPAENRLRGHARFLSPTRLRVDDSTEVEARAVVIATGSVPSVPPPLREFGDRLIVNDDVFEWQTLPESVAVFGPGVIGLELGQALARLGVRTVLLGRGGRIGPLTDPALVEATQRHIGAELYLDPDAEVLEMARDDNCARLRYRALDGSERDERFDYVLAATGRMPNVRDLGLDALGVKRDRAGIPAFDPHTLQVADLPVFIAGDANNERPLLHEAADEGRTAGDNAARFPDVRVGLRRTPLSVVFSDPQIAMVGRGFGSIDRQCCTVGEVDFEGQGRSRVMLKNRGLLHVYGEYGSGRLLGAEMLGPAAEHIAHLLAWAVAQDLTVPRLLEMPFYHPVIEEGVRTALRDLAYKLREGPPPVPGCLDCGPGG